MKDDLVKKHARTAQEAIAGDLLWLCFDWFPLVIMLQFWSHELFYSFEL